MSLNSISASWGFTNTTDATHGVTPKLIDMSTKYACRKSSDNYARMYNTTSPTDQTEVIIYQGDDISKVNQTLPNLYPPKVQKGRSFNVTVEAKKRLSSSDDPTFCVDLPVNVGISFRFVQSQYITSSDLKAILLRAVGALFDSDDSGNDRIDNLMVGQYNPNL